MNGTARICLFAIVLISLWQPVFGLYNDAGNDSCLTIYSDSRHYAVGSIDPNIRADLVFDNQCGKELVDVKLGLFLENEILGRVAFGSIHNYTPAIETVENKSFICNYAIATASITNRTTCVQTTVDVNLSRTEKTLWAGTATSIVGKTIYWAERQIQPARWEEPALHVSTDVGKIDERPDFDLKIGWQDIVLPEGETRLKVSFAVPINYDGQKEFVIKAVSVSDDKIVSILDPDWYNVLCGYRKKITLATSSYLAGDVTNDHAILVQQTAADAADFWAHVQANGSDVRFTAADGTTLLKYYFQRFDDVNNLMDAWVRVTDTFASASDVDIYMYYDCAGFADAQDVAGTLPNSIAVYHSDDGTGTNVSDKINDYNATATNAAIWTNSTIKIGAAGLYPDGLGLGYWMSQDTLLDVAPANLSISFWINPDAAGANYVMDKWNSAGETDYCQIYGAGTDVHADVKGGGIAKSIATTTVMANGNWYHVVFTWNTTDGVAFYFDGVLEAQEAAATTTMGNVGYFDTTIGAGHTGGVALRGKLDEFKVFDVRITEDESMLFYRSENLDLQSYGVEEAEGGSPAAPGVIDLNLVAIEGYDANGVFPEFSYSVDGNLTLDFNVYNSDNNIMWVDINYGLNATQGSGTVIVNDFNLSSDFCTHAQDWNHYIAECSIDWDTSTVPDGNYYIKIDLNGGSKIFKATLNSMKIKAPYIKLQVWDENLGFRTITPSVLFNGTTYPLDSEGKVSLLPPAAGRYTAKIWEDGNYTARYFDFDINALSQIDINVFILQDGNGQNASFKFYDVNQTTVLANYMVRLRHDNNLCSIRYTNASGETSFFLDPDDNYVFDIVESETEILHYYPTAVTIEIPKNEISLANITPFDLWVGGLGEMSWLNQTAAISYYILSNTVSYYFFDVNAGADYYTKSYSVNLKGNPATYNLQPYLVPIADGIKTKITARYNMSSAGIKDIKIDSKKNIFGIGIVLVETAITDSAGEATFSFVTGDTYYLYFYQAGILKYSAELRPTSTSVEYQMYLDTGEFGVVMPTQLDVNAWCYPRTGMAMILGDGTIDMNQTIIVLNTSIQNIRVLITNGSVVIYDVNQTGGDGNHSMFFSQDFNGALLNRMQTIRMVITIITTTGETHVLAYQYTIQVAGTTSRMLLFNMLTIDFPLLFGATQQQRQLGLSIIALFITMIIVGGAAAKVTTDLSGLMFLALAVLGLFVFPLGWIPLGAWALAALAGFAIYLLTRGLF